ncbi:MAG: ATP-binding protein [Lachnospiraceae bacterium]|nr:ATP-binding protein [Lachnospiraceae bacterium]
MKINRKENLRKLKPVIIAWLILATVYCGLLLIEGLFMGGDLPASMITFLAGSILLASFLLVIAIYPHTFFVPVFMCVGTQLMFIFVGAYIHELEFYFFVMFLLVGVFSLMKNIKLLAVCVTCMVTIDIIVLIFFAPTLDWLNHFRFNMKFACFMYGAIFILIQTYNVAQKEGRSERALTAFSSLLRSTPNLMAITGSDSRVLYLSDQMAKFIQYTNKDFAVGQPLIDLIADKELKIMFADVLDADGFYEAITEISIDGEPRHFRVISDKLTGDMGGMFIDIADITPMVKSQKAAEEAQEVAERANNAKSSFLATMSHEIRTPMNAIIGISQIEMQKGDLPDEYSTALENIYSSGNSLLGIINDILDMTKIETGKLELNPAEYDVPSLINDTVQLNVVRIGSKPIEFVLNIDDTLPLRLYGDELRLKQILNNLLSNAIKYTEKGQVTLAINHSEKDGELLLNFIVEDTGQGMKLEDRDKFFSEYTRFNAEANRETEGTGLGLSITKKLVEMMDGTILVESEYGKGSVFMVMVKQKAVECEVIGAELVKQLRKFKFRGNRQHSNLQVIREPMPYGKVLVVDDVETNLYVAKGLMAPYLLNIETAISGFIAVDLVKGGNVYDVIFMDHMMPQMDGIETTGKLRELGYKGTIVALTANALAGNSEMFMKNGFDGFISKPIDLLQLNNTLNKFVRDKQPAEVIEAARQQGGDTNQLSESVDIADAELLAIFRRDAIKAIATISAITQNTENASDDDLRIFVVNVHAMKSALANIGEDEASKMADILERAGNIKDKAEIQAKFKDFLDALQSIIDRIDTSSEEEYSSVDTDPAFLRGQLTLISKACDEYDDLAANAALLELKEKQWTKETKEILDKIAGHILHSEFDEAAADAANFLAEVK